MQRNRSAAGATLLEILVAMLVVGLVATGLITAFVFSRRMTWRSNTELSAAGLVIETTEALRNAVANSLSLTPGIYSDARMLNSPAPNDAAHRLTALNFPGIPNDPDVVLRDFTRFQTDGGVAGATVAAANHGDGRLVVIENAGDNFDGDGQSGISFDGGATTALRRVRVRIKWTSPTA